VVESVLVRPGERVAEGTPLVRLYASMEAAELERIDSELEQHLVKFLRDPSDGAAQGALAGLRAQRDVAAAQIEERTIRAPRAGAVNHVAARAGQSLAPGDLALTLTGGNAEFRVLAVLPGQYRPLLRPGMPLRLEVAGFPYAYQTVTIDSIGDEVVGPAEVRRYLPQAIADAFEITGAMVFVEAPLPGRSFTVSGRSLDYYDGMLAQAEAIVRSESIIVRFVPGLRRLLEAHDQED
jgi:membrane fusion protein (multidrug efflux system)